jgi:hypothetical protein
MSDGHAARATVKAFGVTARRASACCNTPRRSRKSLECAPAIAEVIDALE